MSASTAELERLLALEQLVAGQAAAIDALERRVGNLEARKLGEAVLELARQTHEHAEASRALESRSYAANRRLDDLEALVGRLDGGRSPVFEDERRQARELARAEQERDEAVALMRDLERFDCVPAWKRARDAFLERLGKRKASS